VFSPFCPLTVSDRSSLAACGSLPLRSPPDHPVTVPVGLSLERDNLDVLMSRAGDDFFLKRYWWQDRAYGAGRWRKEGIQKRGLLKYGGT
jgi:hypothetical protein